MIYLGGDAEERMLEIIKAGANVMPQNYLDDTDLNK